MRFSSDVFASHFILLTVNFFSGVVEVKGFLGVTMITIQAIVKRMN